MFGIRDCALNDYQPPSSARLNLRQMHLSYVDLSRYNHQSLKYPRRDHFREVATQEVGSVIKDSYMSVGS